MTTKRELERLARKAFGGRRPSVFLNNESSITSAHCNGRDVSVQAPSLGEERELLAAALRGIIRWKEGKE